MPVMVLMSPSVMFFCIILLLLALPTRAAVDCIIISKLNVNSNSVDFASLNGEWVQITTFNSKPAYKKDDLYLFYTDYSVYHYWVIYTSLIINSDDDDNIWNRGWCRVPDIATCTKWKTYDGNDEEISFASSTCAGSLSPSVKPTKPPTSAVSDDVELIWSDSMDDYAAHWTISGGVIQIDDAIQDICSSDRCVQIKAHNDSDNWMIRTTSLSIIDHLNVYSSLKLRVDMVLHNMNDTDICTVQYRYDTDIDYITYLSFEGDETIDTVHRLAQIVTIPFNNKAKNLYIKLEAESDVNSSFSSYASCYFDNVALYGAMTAKNVIFSDDMTNYMITGWITSNAEAAEQSFDSVCPDGGCAKLSGCFDCDRLGNSMAISIQNITKYFDIYIEYDVYQENVDGDDGCQIWYKYDTDIGDDYFLIHNTIGGNGDILIRNNIATIYDDPQYMDSKVLFIKLAASICDKDKRCDNTCYFDNIYVKGTLLNDTNRPYLYSKVAAMKEKYDKTEHIILFGDFGGRSTEPYYTKEQIVTSHMLSTISKYHDIHGIVTLGDNFYDDGVMDEFDPRFQQTFENVYSHTNVLDIDWFPTTGNHDYHQNITGQIEYSKHSSRWNFPSLYYTKSWYFGTNNEIELQWIALDAVILCGFAMVDDGLGNDKDCIPEDEAQAQIHWDWLDSTLNASNATFKIVGAHTPIYSYAYYGPSKHLVEELDPLLQHYGVNAYVFGHEHTLQFIEDNHTEAKFLQHIGSGAAHGCRDSIPHINSELNPSFDALKYMDCIQGGFVRMEIDVKQVTMQAFFYLPTTPNIQFFSGIWDSNGKYTTINELMNGTFVRTQWPTPEPTPKPTKPPSVALNTDRLELIWFDSMDDYSLYWISHGLPALQIDDPMQDICASIGCVRIKGNDESDDWIIRSTAFNADMVNMYSSLLIRLDIVLYGMEDVNYCNVGFKYDIDTEYTTVISLEGGHSIEHKFGEIGIIPMNTTAHTLFIRLETNGDSYSGGDSCYFDNVALYGELLEGMTKSPTLSPSSVKILYDASTTVTTHNIIGIESSLMKDTMTKNEKGFRAMNVIIVIILMALFCVICGGLCLFCVKKRKMKGAVKLKDKDMEDEEMDDEDNDVEMT